MESQERLKQELFQKELKIQELERLFNLKTQSISNTPVSTAEVLKSRNEMTQFYIKSAGLFLGVVIIAAIANYGMGILTFKTFIPTSIYSFLQNNTSYFASVKDYSLLDSENNLIWLVKITNEQKADLFVKPFKSKDYMDVFKFVKTLDEKSNVVNSCVDTFTPVVLNTANNAEQVNLVIDNIFKCF